MEHLWERNQRELFALTGTQHRIRVSDTANSVPKINTKWPGKKNRPRSQGTPPDCPLTPTAVSLLLSYGKYVTCMYLNSVYENSVFVFHFFPFSFFPRSPSPFPWSPQTLSEPYFPVGNSLVVKTLGSFTYKLIFLHWMKLTVGGFLVQTTQTGEILHIVGSF